MNLRSVSSDNSDVVMESYNVGRKLLIYLSSSESSSQGNRGVEGELKKVLLSFQRERLPKLRYDALCETFLKRQSPIKDPLLDEIGDELFL